MPQSANSRLGGHVLADQLRIQGVDTVFTVPGESYLGLLDGLYEHRGAIRVITARHESGAANMADAYAKMTGRPGVCAVSRGPGATNAANGMHSAFQDSVPLILFVGQVPRGQLGREAQQEIDYRDMFRPLAKWVGTVDAADRIPEHVAHAFYVSQSGRPGPVVLVLPEDMLIERTGVSDARPVRLAETAPPAGSMAELRERLARAERPLVLVGGPGWTQPAVDDMTRFVEANGLPVLTSYRAQDRFDNRNDHYIGHCRYNERVEQMAASDLVIAAGPRLGQVTTAAYTLMDVPNPGQTLIHAHPGGDELGSVYQPDLAINCSMPAFCSALAALGPVGGGRWKGWLEAARAAYLDSIAPVPMSGEVNLSEIVRWLSDTLPDDAVMINGSGNNSGWVHRFYQFRGLGSQHVTTSGSMGYAVPAAVAAQLAFPGRTVVSVNGDGCFMMLGQEMATALQYGLEPIFIIVNNAMLATIRMHQERQFPGRVVGTDLVNPDFTGLGRDYGAHAETVRRTEEFAPAFERARASGRMALIEVLIDRNVLTPALELGRNI
jgi:acetolactate synthase-1/2/3 large subunit